MSVGDSKKDLKEEVLQFRELILETGSEASGVVSVYGGRKSRVNEIRDLIEFIDKTLGLGNGYNERAWIREGGYRETATVVFILKPYKCSDYSLPASELAADNIELEEFPEDETISLSEQDFETMLVESVTAICSPAARAVRVCSDDTKVEVFIAVDEKGNTQFAKAISGHPLNRPAAESFAKKRKYAALNIEGVSSKTKGVIRISFKEAPEIITN